MELFPPDTKNFAWKAWQDAQEKTSTRLVCLVIYGFFRTCEFVDWLFPVKTNSIKEARKVWKKSLTNTELAEWNKSKSS